MYGVRCTVHLLIYLCQVDGIVCIYVMINKIINLWIQKKKEPKRMQIAHCLMPSDCLRPGLCAMYFYYCYLRIHAFPETERKNSPRPNVDKNMNDFTLGARVVLPILFGNLFNMYFSLIFPCRFFVPCNRWLPFFALSLSPLSFLLDFQFV